MKGLQRRASFVVAFIIIASLLSACGFRSSRQANSAPDAHATADAIARAVPVPTQILVVDTNATAEPSGPTVTADSSAVLIEAGLRKIDFEPVSAAGGEVSGPSDTAVEVPEGALGESAELAITTDVVVPPPTLSSDSQVVGPVYTVISSEPVTLEEPLTITIPAPEALPPGATVETLRAMYYDGDTWQPVEGRQIAAAPGDGGRLPGLAAPAALLGFKFTVPKIPGSWGWIWGDPKLPELEASPLVSYDKNPPDLVRATVLNKKQLDDGRTQVDLAVLNTKSIPLHIKGRAIRGKVSDPTFTFDGAYSVLWPKKVTVFRDLVLDPDTQLQIEATKSGIDDGLYVMTVANVLVVFTMASMGEYFSVSASRDEALGLTVQGLDAASNLKELQKLTGSLRLRLGTAFLRMEELRKEGKYSEAVGALAFALGELSDSDLDPLKEYINKTLGRSVIKVDFRLFLKALKSATALPKVYFWARDANLARDYEGFKVAAPETGEMSGLFPIYENDGTESRKTGYIDRSGAVVIKPQYGSAGYFSDGFALASIDSRHFIIDETGSVVADLNDNPDVVAISGFGISVSDHFTQGRAWVDNDVGHWILIDDAGRTVLDLDLVGDESGVSGFTEGLAAVGIDGQWGYIDRAGQFTIPTQFDSASYFSEGVASVGTGDGEAGTMKYGYIDRTGAIVISPRFDRAGAFSEGLAAVELGGKWGYVDKAGAFVISARFDNAEEFSEGLALVEVGDKWGYIDKTGTLVIQPRFDEPGRDPRALDGEGGNFSGGLAVVRIGEKDGFVDHNGKMVIRPQYLLATGFSGGLALVAVGRDEDDARLAYIDQTGKRIWEESRK